MLVYGDRSRTVETRVQLARIAATLDQAAKSAGRPERLDLHTRALIDTGELAQGIADAEFKERGCDDRSAAQTASLALAFAIARKLQDWRNAGSDFRRLSCPSTAALEALPLPDRLVCNTAEGYAFYAVYPETYMATAAAYPWSEPPLVIGLRSIGTGLAAAVAAATGAALLVTLRPCGHPFRREVRVSDELKRCFTRHTGPFALVDEGPGLSGSSFGAVADLLEDLGVAPSRIVFLPSHGGDLGGEASPRNRARWASARRSVTTFDDLLRREPLDGWFTDLIGAVDSVEDFSSGQWRAEWRESHRAPVWAQRERRKFRLTTPSGQYLARFAGLGHIGELKFAQAKALFTAGFTPEPIALRRGLLLERWVEGGPVDLGPANRQRFLDHLARYLSFRAASFPASAKDGASLAELVEMAATNARELGGSALSQGTANRLSCLEGLRSAPRSVHVDARLHRWEWLQRADGRYCKTDALDHANAHDLVGCQDIIWDVAGAAIEFRLSAPEQQSLAERLSSTSGCMRSSTVETFKILYAAFHAGACVMAATTAGADDQHQLRRELERYCEVLSLDPKVAKG